MNILYFKAGGIASMIEHTIYTDLLNEFARNGHKVYVIAANERRTGKGTEHIAENGIHILRVKTGNITKCNSFEKGISMLLFESHYIGAIKKYYSNIKFDLVLYSTPPIMAVGVVEYIKKRDSATSYLMLKDIFPQNAVDIGMMKDKGIRGLLYKYFRKKEIALYSSSDRIGCMSNANIKFLVDHNPQIDIGKINICPNCINCVDMSVDEKRRIEIRKKYDIPLDKKVFIYGGNLGKPQGIDFMIECLRKQNSPESYFLIVGDGTEFSVIENYISNEKPKNVKLMKRLPKEDFDAMVGACDVGLIFLDHRFTIPNFPSRLLAYMQAKIPVYAVTDTVCDIKEAIWEGKFGWWTESNDVDAFCSQLAEIEKSDLNELGKNGYDYLIEYYSIEKAYSAIMGNQFKENK